MSFFENTLIRVYLRQTGHEWGMKNERHIVVSFEQFNEEIPLNSILIWSFLSVKMLKKFQKEHHLWAVPGYSKSRAQCKNVCQH